METTVRGCKCGLAREFHFASSADTGTDFLHDLGHVARHLGTSSSSVKFRSQYLPHTVGRYKLRGGNACDSMLYTIKHMQIEASFVWCKSLWIGGIHSRWVLELRFWRNWLSTSLLCEEQMLLRWRKRMVKFLLPPWSVWQGLWIPSRVLWSQRLIQQFAFAHHLKKKK